MTPRTRKATSGSHHSKDGGLRVRKLALVGAGKLGEALLSGILGSQLVPAGHVEATVAHQPRADYLAEKYGIKAHTENARAAERARELVESQNT